MMYKLKFHPTLASRWQNFSQTQQIYMIGNELNRAVSAATQNDPINIKDALERAFELIDLMVENTSNGRQKELLRLREVMAGYYLEPQTASVANLKQLCRVLLSFDGPAFNTLGAQYE